MIFQVVCFIFLAFWWGKIAFFVHNKVGGLGACGCFRWKTWTSGWTSELLIFAILVGCLHYHRCRHCKTWKNSFGDPPFTPNIFCLASPFEGIFLACPPSNSNRLFTFHQKRNCKSCFQPHVAKNKLQVTNNYLQIIIKAVINPTLITKNAAAKNTFFLTI